MENSLDNLSVVELKALAYDTLTRVEQGQMQLRIIAQAIAQKNALPIKSEKEEN